MNPFDEAWLLLKMTPEEMEAAGFPEAAQQMRAMQEQQQQVSQQAQATAPRETPQTQLYQQQLDSKQAKEEEAQRIRAMLKEGRRVADARKLTQEFYQTHGHYPKRVPKKIIQRLEALRLRDD